MTDCHTNTATAPLSVCHEAPVQTLPIQADLSWSPLPLVPLCTTAFSCFFSSYYILLPFCLFALFVWTVTCRYLALKLLWACRFLCQSRSFPFNRTWHSSFPPDTPDTFFKAAVFSSDTWQSWWTQHRVYSSLTAHLMLPCRHHAFQRTKFPLPPFLSVFSPALAFARLLQFERFLFHRLQTGVALRLPSTCSNHPILRLGHLFWPLLLLRFR